MKSPSLKFLIARKQKANMQTLYQIDDEICEEGDCTSPAVAVINYKKYCSRHGGYLLVPSSIPAPLDTTKETLKVIGNATYCLNCGHWLWREAPSKP